jgi:vacuolar-type H+-ATPase subunit H
MGKEHVLKEVREAERSVRDMLEEAERERDSKQSQARREADRIQEAGLSLIDKEIEEEFQTAHAETRKLVEDRIEQGRIQVDQKRRDAQGNLPQAVDKLVEELEGSINKG